MALQDLLEVLNHVCSVLLRCFYCMFIVCEVMGGDKESRTFVQRLVSLMLRSHAIRQLDVPFGYDIAILLMLCDLAVLVQD